MKQSLISALSSSAAYSMSSILRCEKYIQDCLDLCFSKLKNRADEGDVVELSEWTNALAFDVVGELAYGKDLGHLRSESDVNGLRAMILGIFKVCSVLGHFPGQSGLINNSIVNTVMGIFGGENGFQKFHNWTIERIAARRNGVDGADRTDMLTHFLNMKSLEGKDMATDEEVLGEAAPLM